MELCSKGNLRISDSRYERFYILRRCELCSKKLTLEDKLKAERAEKMELLRKQAQLEEAILELAQTVSNSYSRRPEKWTDCTITKENRKMQTMHKPIKAWCLRGCSYSLEI